MKITKRTLIGDIFRMQEAQKLVPVLLDARMGHIGCPSAQTENLEQICAYHGVDCENLIGELNSALNT